MAFSPANFSLVQMYEDGQIKWHNLEYTLEDPTTISDGWWPPALGPFLIYLKLINMYRPF